MVPLAGLTASSRFHIYVLRPAASGQRAAFGGLNDPKNRTNGRPEPEPTEYIGRSKVLSRPFYCWDLARMLRFRTEPPSAAHLPRSQRHDSPPSGRRRHHDEGPAGGV